MAIARGALSAITLKGVFFILQVLSLCRAEEFLLKRSVFVERTKKGLLRQPPLAPPWEGGDFYSLVAVEQTL